MIDDYSKYRYGYNKRIGTKYFVKVIPKEYVLKYELVTNLYNERKCFDIINQLPYTVSYYGHTDDEFFFYQFYTFIPGGHLSKIIFTLDDPTFNKFIAAQVFCFIDKCIDLQYVFRNISNTNIIIARDGYIRIINSIYGIKISEESKLQTLCGNLEYACPEMFSKKGYGHNADIWALGVLVYYLHFLTTPFVDRDPTKVIENIINAKYNLTNIEDLKLRKLIETCLNPKKRPNNAKDMQKMNKLKYWEGIKLNHIVKKNLPTPFQPMVKSEDDLTSFEVYPETDTKYDVLASNDDPFVMW
eukprot:Mrub_05320.p1 GENE.Mrub_05320~~Mrub_05320.p1  ORF type:complete len:325 (+),score=69.99 Mrub_05320:76-975(+)